METKLISNINYKKFSAITVIFLSFLIFIKIDYRINEPNSEGASDDTSYYFHASTLAKDFDLDYTNQVSQTNYEQFYNSKKNSYVPRHPFGAGLLSSPFMFLGVVIERISNTINISYFVYSLSSLFYLCISYSLLSRILYKSLKKNRALFNVSFFGSGILYYATERFSMTHSYEFFATSFLIYMSYKIEHSIKTNDIKNLNKLLFFTSFLSFVFLSIRWTNYYIFLIPFLYFSINKNLKYNTITMLKNLWFYIGFLIGIGVFLLHTQSIYGIYTFNAWDIYSASLIIENLNNMFYGRFDSGFLNFITINLINFYRILFSLEFGLFFISPVLFILFLFPIYYLFKKQILNFVILLIILFVPLGTVLAWQTTASSFGYRYLFSLIPIGIFVIFKESPNKITNKYLLLFGIFSILSTLFFETNQLTVLDEQINSFGVLHKYSAPQFVLGVVVSIFSITSYLKIFFTSYLGVLFIKILYLLNLDNLFIDLVIDLGFWNNDVERLINYSINFYWLNFSLLVLIFYLFYKSIKQPGFIVNYFEK